MKVFNSLDGVDRKILILHDTFLYKGGGERLILMMAKALDADIASGFFSRGSFNLRDEGFQGKMIEISSETFKKGYRHLKLKKAFLLKTKFLQDYDTVIFSGDCISAVINARIDSKKIYYCHTPPRYLYDLREEYLSKLSNYIKPAFNLISWGFRKMYESDVKKFDLILTNSKNTQKRLEHFVGEKSEILYPPVKLDEFKWIEQGDYYLSVSRLSSAKRIDNIVKAFKEMPDKKLVVIYGLNDPQKDEIFEIGKDCKNIEFVTCSGNEGFTDYIGNCIAGICVPINEDFGMVPIESMAAGKPVIGVDEGGIKETIINGETGVLIPSGGSIEDIKKATDYLTPEIALSMKSRSIERAGDFSYDEFAEKIKNFIK